MTNQGEIERTLKNELRSIDIQKKKYDNGS